MTTNSDKVFQRFMLCVASVLTVGCVAMVVYGVLSVSPGSRGDQLPEKAAPPPKPTVWDTPLVLPEPLWLQKDEENLLPPGVQLT